MSQVTILHDKDADASCLNGKTVAVIGYGSQGTAQALCMRDSGVNVIIGTRKGPSFDRAVSDGFQVMSAGEAAAKADIIHILLPDEFHKSTYDNEIKQHMTPGKTLSCSHGFNVVFKQILPPEGCDVIMVAPKSPATEERKAYLAGFGVPGLVAVAQNATGKALNTALAMAKAMGFTRAGVLECTFEQEKQKEEKQCEYTNRRITYIFKKLVKVHNFPVIVSPQIFDFVTAGMSLDKEGLKAVWEGYKSQEQRNSTNPAYSLLEKLMHSQWNMSNEEMADAVMQLVKYVEEGKFCDNMAYVNSATYLQHFCSLTSLSLEDMQTKIISGIDKMYESIDTPNLLDKLNLDVVETEIPEESRWVVRYEREKMDKITKANLDTDIKEVLRQFNEDLPTLANRLTIQYGDTKTPDFLSYPILSHIPMEYIIDKVNKIRPKEVMALYHILNDRFLEYMAAPKVYEAELTFVRNLEHALAQKNSNKTTYADILIEDHLKGVIEKVNRSR